MKNRWWYHHYFTHGCDMWHLADSDSDTGDFDVLHDQ